MIKVYVVMQYDIETYIESIWMYRDHAEAHAENLEHSRVVEHELVNSVGLEIAPKGSAEFAFRYKGLQ